MDTNELLILCKRHFGNRHFRFVKRERFGTTSYPKNSGPIHVATFYAGLQGLLQRSQSVSELLLLLPSLAAVGCSPNFPG
jgi:hypothetical protein